MAPKIIKGAKVIKGSKIIDMNHQLSNAEVLTWLENKRKQHVEEDAEDEAAGRDVKPRPQNFVKMLDKTERHLKSDAYPYVANPSAYKDMNQDYTVSKFGAETMKKIQKPLFEKFKDDVKKGLMTKKQAKAKLEDEQDKKELTDPEFNTIFNLAPTCVEMLEPIIEEVDDRFTKEELELMVQIIKDVLRPDETGSVYAEGGEKAGPVKDLNDAMNMGEMAGALRQYHTRNDT